MGHHPSVEIIVLSFNGFDDTCECLNSLRVQTYSKNQHVIVVDNASQDESACRLRTRFPEVEVIPLSENLGWAGGNNIGIRLAIERRRDFVCLLNNDTVLEPDTIECMTATAAELGPCILLPVIDCYDSPGTPQFDMTSMASTPRELSRGGNAYRMEGLYGACLMAHTEIYKTIGLFDERFFLQLEETDFYHRAKREGIETFWIRNARILHKESRSFGGRVTPLKTYYSVRNQWLLVEKHGSQLQDYFTAARKIYWSLTAIASGRGLRMRSRIDFLLWLTSRDIFAQAARQGFADYCLRRFGHYNSRNRTPLTLSDGGAIELLRNPTP